MWPAVSRERGSEIKSSVGRFLVDEGAFCISLVLVWKGKSTERGISISHCSVTWQKVSLVSFYKRTESGYSHLSLSCAGASCHQLFLYCYPPLPFWGLQQSLLLLVETLLAVNRLSTKTVTQQKTQRAN